MSAEESEPHSDDSINDELVEMRGEGRYFGVTENLGPICHNCHEKGHIAVNCPVVICDTCGEKNDHFSNQCPQSTRCRNCGEFGHVRADCTRRINVIFCYRCESKTHSASTCPKIWRRYHQESTSTKNLVLPETIFCYNCAEEGHYGDNCEQPHRGGNYYKQVSAFNSQNLHPMLKKRFNQLKSRRRPLPPPPYRREPLPYRREPLPPRPMPASYGGFGPHDTQKNGNNNKKPKKKTNGINKNQNGSNSKKSLGQRIQDGTKKMFKRK